MVSTLWPLSCFLFFCTLCPRAQSLFCKSGGTCPRALWSRWDSFTPKKIIIKQPFNLNSQCHKDSFLVFELKVMHRVILLTWFCKLLPESPNCLGGGGTCLKCLNGTTPLSACRPKCKLSLTWNSWNGNIRIYCCLFLFHLCNKKAVLAYLKCHAGYGSISV